MNSENQVSTSLDALAMMERYQDAYRVARITIKIGQVLKAVAIIIGVVVALGSMILTSSMNFIIVGGDPSPAAIIGGLLGGSVSWFLAYLFALGFTNRGQTTLASLDDAVNSCRLFDDTHRAKIFSLPSATNLKFVNPDANVTMSSGEKAELDNTPPVAVSKKKGEDMPFIMQLIIGVVIASAIWLFLSYLVQ